MTESEIMKALECCKKRECCECPRVGKFENVFLCYADLTHYVLNLINRKNAEIEALQKKDGAECPTCHGTGRTGTTDWLTKGMSAEQIAEKKAKAIAECNTEIRAEAIKEVLQKVKKTNRSVAILRTSHIDQIAKELGVEL